MAKVVYNQCYGGFGLSREAVLLGRKLSNNKLWGGACINGDIFSDGQKCDKDYGSVDDIARHDPILIKIVETLGKKANGMCADLAIRDIGKSGYRISEYDGMENVVCSEEDWIIP